MSAAHLRAPSVQPTAGIYWSGCTGKIRHATLVAAKAQARRINNIVYQCRWCGGWHTTSKPLVISSLIRRETS